MTCSDITGKANVLLQLVSDGNVSNHGKSVAETWPQASCKQDADGELRCTPRSVIIFLHGEQECRQASSSCCAVTLPPRSCLLKRCQVKLYALCGPEVDILMERDVVSSYCVPIMVLG